MGGVPNFDNRMAKRMMQVAFRSTPADGSTGMDMQTLHSGTIFLFLFSLTYMMPVL